MRSVYNRIGPYDIHQEIGRGGMAVVFLATDTTTEQRVALRTVPTYTAPDVLAAEHRGAELQEQFCRVSGFVPQVYKYGTEADFRRREVGHFLFFRFALFGIVCVAEY